MFKCVIPQPLNFLASLVILLSLSGTATATSGPQPNHDLNGDLSSFLIFDADEDPELPRNFRSSKSPYDPTSIEEPSRLGLDVLNISGSGQFTKDNFNTIFQRLNVDSGYIIDLRLESHGFLDLTPVSWFGLNDAENADKTPLEVEHLEKQLLSQLNQKQEVIIYQRIKKNTSESYQPQHFTFETACPEQSFVDESGLKYLRIYVLDHYPPNDTQIDQFVDFVKQQGSIPWIHFHCHAGYGRTTTFMILYDMIRNANQVSAHDIILRQGLIGGENFYENTNTDVWRLAINRKKVHILDAFHQYVKDPEGYAKRSWSAWRNAKA